MLQEKSVPLENVGSFWILAARVCSKLLLLENNYLNSFRVVRPVLISLIVLSCFEQNLENHIWFLQNLRRKNNSQNSIWQYYRKLTR